MWETLSFPLSLSLSFLMFATSNIYHQQQQQPPSLLTARAPTTTFTSFTRLLVCSLAVRWWRQAYTALLLLYVLYTHGASSAAAATFVEHLKIQEKHRQTDRQVRGVVCSIEHTHLRALYFRSLHLASPTEALRYPFLHQFVFVGTDSELEWSSIHSLYGGIAKLCLCVFVDDHGLFLLLLLLLLPILGRPRFSSTVQSQWLFVLAADLHFPLFSPPPSQLKHHRQMRASFLNCSRLLLCTFFLGWIYQQTSFSGKRH